MGEAENRAGKAALSRPKAGGQKAQRSGVFERLMEEEARAVCEWREGAASRWRGTQWNAAGGSRLRQGWRDFLLCSEVFLREKASVAAERVNEMELVECRARENGDTLAWDRKCAVV